MLKIMVQGQKQSAISSDQDPFWHGHAFGIDHQNNGKISHRKYSRGPDPQDRVEGLLGVEGDPVHGPLEDLGGLGGL